MMNKEHCGCGKKEMPKDKKADMNEKACETKKSAAEKDAKGGKSCN